MGSYRSKRDGWLSIILIGTIVILLLALVPLLKTALSGRLASLPGIALLLASLVLAASVLTNTRYAVQGDILRIQSGPFRWTVGIKDIVRVTETDDPSSAPALSLDRLSIQYQQGGSIREILVSPRERAAFVAALRAVNPDIDG